MLKDGIKLGHGKLQLKVMERHGRVMKIDGYSRMRILSRLTLVVPFSTMPGMLWQL